MSQQLVIAMPQLGFDPFRLYMKGKYVQSLRRAGARVQWLPIRDLDRAAALLRGCDGLLMPGGADLAPSYYGQTTRPECGTIKPERDAADWRLLQEWQGTGKPLLHVFGYRQVVLQRFLARCAHKLPKILHVLRLPFCHCTPARARMAAKWGAGRFFAANAAAFLQNAHTLAKIIS